MTENERVKELRKSLGLTQEKFGERVGLKKSAISQIESGVNGVTDQLRLAVFREFNVNEDWLRTGEGSMFVEPDEDEEIARFVGDVLSDKPDFRRRLISVLSRMTPDEWALLEAKIRELSEE